MPIICNRPYYGRLFFYELIIHLIQAVFLPGHVAVYVDIHGDLGRRVAEDFRLRDNDIEGQKIFALYMIIKESGKSV
jgi:hypothetical protein